MTRRPDRYVRRGGPITQIYPGTLAGLAQALKDAISTSKFRPDTVFRLIACYGADREVFRLFQGGHCTWEPESEAEV